MFAGTYAVINNILNMWYETIISRVNLSQNLWLYFKVLFKNTYT